MVECIIVSPIVSGTSEEWIIVRGVISGFAAGVEERIIVSIPSVPSSEGGVERMIL